MQCFNDYKGDRICELCERVNRYDFEKCKKEHDEKVKLRQKLFEIESKCPHRIECWDEYQRYYGCDKKSGDDNDCIVTLECERYFK